MRGLVISGSRNRFAVRRPETGEVCRCVIKGKVLKLSGRYYNPLCPGDIVEYAPEAGGEGRVLALEPRANFLSRYNEKGRLPQLLAANVDQALVISSAASPPFRPRFIDRVLIQCEKAGVAGIVVVNKIDLLDAPGMEAETRAVEERLAVFAALGYAALRVSAVSGAGLEGLRAACAGKRSVLVGQSGAGKSALANALVPGARQKTGELSRKYGRGAHTTVMAALLEGGGGQSAALVDTPGLRRFIPDGVTPARVAGLMPDLAPFAARCRFGASCAHGREEGCAVLDARARGLIHHDRWNTFLALSRPR